MAYKRNPMRSERICSLSRHVMALAQDAAMTASTQWFERTLDDSAVRRICMPEAFMAVDAVLELYCNVADGLVVYPRVIARRVDENLPFMATENVLMEAVKNGGDRQAVHERIRQHSQAAARRVKEDGLDNNLIELMANDPEIPVSREEIVSTLKAENFIGRCPAQVDEFIAQCVDPALATAEATSMEGVKV